MTTPPENNTPLFEPFPMPNTIPHGWDMSELVPEPEPASTQPANATPEA